MTEGKSQLKGILSLKLTVALAEGQDASNSVEIDNLCPFHRFSIEALALTRSSQPLSTAQQSNLGFNIRQKSFIIQKNRKILATNHTIVSITNEKWEIAQQSLTVERDRGRYREGDRGMDPRAEGLKGPSSAPHVFLTGYKGRLTILQCDGISHSIGTTRGDRFRCPSVSFNLEKTRY